MTGIFNKESTKIKRRKVRTDMTTPERQLWKCIRNDSLGVRIRRQYGIGKYIVDFYSPKLKLVIEIDGDDHYTDSSKRYDSIRTDYMNSIGIKVIRYTNQDVMINLDAVVSDLQRVIDEIVK